SLTAWVAVMGHLYSTNKERGIYKTMDGGITWKQTLFVDEHTGAIDLQLNPQQPNELYAAMWYRNRKAWNFEEAGPTSGIYKSVDGGSTWQLISGAGAGFPTGPGTGRIGLAVYPPSPATIYAVVDNQDERIGTEKANDSTYQLSDFKALTKAAFLQLDTAKLTKFLRANRVPFPYTAARLTQLVELDSIAPTALYNYLFVDDGFQNKSVKGCEVYRSSDAGKTWTKTHQQPIDNYSSYGYYFGKIYVSPMNPEKVFILGIDLMVSENGGKTFTSIDKPNVHSDHHALWINPLGDNHIINGNDGGCNISYDKGEAWFKVQTPAVGQYYAITVDNAKPYNVYGGLQDNGSWYGPSNHKESAYWMERGEYAYKRLGGGDGMQAQVDNRTNQLVYSGSQFGYYTRIDLHSKERKMIRPTHRMGEFPLRFNWQTPILLSSHNQDILYYGSNKFHRSLNRGDQLQTMSGDLSKGGKTGDVPFGTITTITESPLRFGLIYIGTDDGTIQLTKDGGTTWTMLGKPAKKNPGLPQDLYVSRVVASKWKEGRVYVCLNGYRDDHFTAYVFMSEDFGQSWKQLGKELPPEPVNVIREDPKEPAILYLGTDGGVYASLDGGNRFHAFTKDLPVSIPVHDLAIQEEANELVVATHGRSIYIGSLKPVQDLLKKDQGKKN
ncbi:exo-alpha-sialidase, partial [Flavihumibacter sp. CACIAM 22H1]|uniref:exo-alpha-sialidase n=1 Tax=Flavihumibacter sp. CACIAM 22H1 TaxID=1812911 RepID=UPI0007A8B143